MSELLDKLVACRPSDRQVAWQKLEFTAFFCYGINSFTDREWGDGTEDPAIFDPKELNTDLWCEALVDAGIKACIITAKHHDGFCLWDTACTDHSVMHTPYGKDVVAQLAASCFRYGIRLGIYLSPWDRHDPRYGTGKAYDDYFCDQLTELLTHYGPIYSVWFDGACGEGPGGRHQDYDWPRYYKLIRELQPEAVISICGPDVRWVGNEAGRCRTSEWSVVLDRPLNESDPDLGSRSLMAREQAFRWYPAEVDTSIRPGWFHHDSEDDKIRPLEELVQIYMNSVGGNAVLLLNIPPHRDGYLTRADRKRLRELGDYLDDCFFDNKADRPEVRAIATAAAPGFPAEAVLKDDETYYRSPADEGEGPVALTLIWNKLTEVRYIVLQEQIRDSQRVESFEIEAILADGSRKILAESTVIGYKRILPVDPVEVIALTVRFTGYRQYPTLRFLGIY